LLQAPYLQAFLFFQKPNIIHRRWNHSITGPHLFTSLTVVRDIIIVKTKGAGKLLGYYFNHTKF